MRKIFFLILVSLVAISCDDTELNSPIIQGEVDNQFFRSRAQAVVNDNGQLVIRGSEQDVLTLRVNNVTTGTYNILPNSGNRATFLRDGELFITSGPNTGGEIVIERIDEEGITGNFFFSARLNGVGRMINFSRGVFFNVPFASFDIEIPLPEDPENGDED